MENAPEKLISRVLNILHSCAYGVSPLRLREMEILARHAIVYQLKGTPDFQTMPLCDCRKRPVGNISIRSVSQTIDAPPMFHKGERIDVSPTLALTGNASAWTILHEICHLLSIGPYIPLAENRFYHYFGICEFSYQLENGRLERRTFQGHNGINELLTDYAAWHFMRLLCGDAVPFYSGTERFRQYVDTLWGNDMRPEILIGWHFSGNSRNISELLLGGYKDYESLCRALFER